MKLKVLVEKMLSFLSTPWSVLFILCTALTFKFIGGPGSVGLEAKSCPPTPTGCTGPGKVIYVKVVCWQWLLGVAPPGYWLTPG